MEESEEEKHELMEPLLDGKGAADEEALISAGIPHAGLSPRPPPSPSSSGKRKEIHWVVASLIIFAFSAPAALVGLGFAMGQAGLVFGPVYCSVVTLASVGGANLLIDLLLVYPHCQNLPELGRAAMGPWGGVLVACCQLLNFTLFLPVSLLINAQALQGLLGVSASSCVAPYMLAISLVCFSTTQVRQLSNAQSLTLASLTAVFLALCIQLTIVLTHPPPPPPPPPSPLPSLFSLLLGLSTFSWSFVPSFLLIELASAMPHPSLLRRSLWLSSLLLLLLFTCMGLPLVLHWGPHIPDPIYLLPSWPSHSPLSRLMMFLLLSSNLVSYALDSAPLVRYCQRTFHPTFDVHDWSFKAVLRYALLSLPTFLFGLLAALTVGNLLSLLAFVTALSVPWVTQILPPLLYYSATASPKAHPKPQVEAQVEVQVEGQVEAAAGGDTEDQARRIVDMQHETGPEGVDGGVEEKLRGLGRDRGRRLMAALVLVIGVGTFGVCMAAAIGKVWIKELRGPTVIGCGRWTIYSDRDQFP